MAFVINVGSLLLELLLMYERKLVLRKYHGFYLEMMKNLGKEVLTFWEKGERELAR